MIKTALTAALAILLAAIPAAGRDSLSFATVHSQAYADTELPEYGAASAIIAEACRRVDMSPTFHFMPWKRAMDAVVEGRFDALYSAYYSLDRERTYAISAPYMSVQLVLCVRKDSHVAWDGTLASLTPYRIGVVLGYVNTRELDKADNLNLDIAPSEELNIRKLLEGRVDAIVTGKGQARYMLEKDASLGGSADDVKFLSPPLEIKHMYVMFSRALPRWESNLARFNKGLRLITDDGSRDAILKRFGLDILDTPRSAPGGDFPQNIE